MDSGSAENGMDFETRMFKFKAAFLGAGGNFIGDETRMLFRLVLIR
jgi:hypothetical protein